MKITNSPLLGKKFKVTTPLGRTLHFGAEGYRIKPGTEAGDSYCARSYGITDKTGKPTRDDPERANYWSRRMWRCKGKVSLK